MSNVDNIKSKDDYMNANLFNWFTGVIEDIDDPEQRGRYRVRCFGYHTERKDYIPTTSLPWAHVMMPVTGAAQSGVGQSATGLLRGSWVVGFFRDGPSAQDPLIMGTIPSITPSVDYKYGFTDPTKQYPYFDKVGDQDIPEESISKDLKFMNSFSYKKKDQHRASFNGVQIAFNGKWDLPPVSSIVNPQYPKNHVKAYERKVFPKPVVEPQTPSTGILEGDKPKEFKGQRGLNPLKEMHVEEFDTTPNFERISWMHASGTYKEWTPKGDETVVIVGDEYRIVAKNQHINVKGDCTITVEGNCHTLVKGDEYVHVMGNKTELVQGNYTQTVMGNVTKSFLLNEMRFVGMNSSKRVLMNTSLTTLLNDKTFVGLKRNTITGAGDDQATFGPRSTNTFGKVSEYSFSGREEVVPDEIKIWNLNGIRTVIRTLTKPGSHEIVSEFNINHRAKLNIDLVGAATAKVSGGAIASFESNGPTAVQGNPITDNGHIPMLFP